MERAGMSALSGFHHVKLPVADVGRNREWYERVLGLELSMEFVEDGVLMGVALRSPDGSVQLAARQVPHGLPHWPVSTRSLSACPPARTLRIGCADSTGSASRTAGSSPATSAG
jgi:catechol 2,3-dioxygenase-like lactoylglutathione lyase family enzyme